MNSSVNLIGAGLTVSFFSLLASGCGGGSDVPATIEPGTYTQGIWRGSAAAFGGDLRVVVGMIDKYGNANLVLYASPMQLNGQIAIDPAGGVTLNNFLGLYGTGGGLSDNFHYVSGSVSAGNSLLASYTSTTRTDSPLELNLSYDGLYDRPASYQTLAGHWRYAQSTQYVDWYVDTAGALTGSDSDGCTYTGSLRYVDPAHDMYRVKYTIAGCSNLYSFPVNVSGLSVLMDNQQANDTLVSAGTGIVGFFYQSKSFVETLTRV